MSRSAERRPKLRICNSRCRELRTCNSSTPPISYMISQSPNQQSNQPTNQPTKVPFITHYFCISRGNAQKINTKQVSPNAPSKEIPTKYIKRYACAKLKATKYTYSYLSPSLLSIRYHEHHIHYLPSVVLSQCLSARVRRGV